jgi:hypothetical protein
MGGRGRIKIEKLHMPNQDWPGEPSFDDKDEEEFDDDWDGTEDLPGMDESDKLVNPYPRFTLEQLRGMQVDDLRPFFKDVRQVWRTASLFEETSEDPAKYPPIYSLKDDDTSSCVSLKRLYLAIEDVTEHTFASMCLGSWEHWEAIQKSWILQPHIEKWRELLELQLRAKYLRMIKEQAEYGEGPNSLNATKYLLESTTRFGKDKTSRGRPSAKEKAQALAREVKDSSALAADAKRLGISVVK